MVKISHLTNLEEEIGRKLDCNVWDRRHRQGNSVLQVRQFQVSLQTCDTSISDISTILPVLRIQDKKSRIREIITKNDRK